MRKLRNLHHRHQVRLQVIEGGSGFIFGMLGETDQTQIPAYTFVNPRRILRTNFNTALRAGMVLLSPSNERFVVGENGAADDPSGPLWQSWRLFEANRRCKWQRRTQIIDPVTELKREGQLVDLGYIWMAIEPLDRESPDRQMRTSHEQDRFLAGADVRADDIIDGKKVIRSDTVLGIRLGTITN